ncbi:transposase [Acetobacter sp.]|uniref:transposase n=1 Tax=Acetobacter sp. TaxID=440 RepID=UPI0039E8FAE1
MYVRHEAEPTTVIDSRTLRSTPESGSRVGYDGAKRKKGSKLHMAVDTLGHLLALHVTPADRTTGQSRAAGTGYPAGNRRQRATILGRSGLYRGQSGKRCQRTGYHTRNRQAASCKVHNTL